MRQRIVLRFELSLTSVVKVKEQERREKAEEIEATFIKEPDIMKPGTIMKALIKPKSAVKAGRPPKDPSAEPSLTKIQSRDIKEILKTV